MITKLATVRSLYIRNITRFNMRVVVNSLLWPFLLFAYLRWEYVGYDWLNLMVILVTVLVKLCQNYLLCSLEGERVIVGLSDASK